MDLFRIGCRVWLPVLFASTTFSTTAIAIEATTPPVTNATHRMSPIVVTATRTERDLFDVPASVAVVTSKQMERSPKRTIAEALQDIPGVDVTDGGMGGGAKRVSIRGESAARVLILIDGMKLSEQKSMDGSMLLVGPENIERIEVIKGPASVLYGSEAIGGVVNIITKKGGSKPAQATLSTTIDGSNKAVTSAGSLSGYYKGFGYRVSGDYTDAGNKRGGSGTIANTHFIQRNYSSYLDYSWDNGKIGGGYDSFYGDINIPSATSSGAHVAPDLPSWKRDRFYSFFELENISTYLHKIRINGFTQKLKKDFANAIDITQSIPMGPFITNLTVESDIFTVNKQLSYGGTLQTDWKFGEGHYVITGIDYLRDDLEATEDRASFTTLERNGIIMPGYPRPSADNGKYKNKAHAETLALFIQDEWSLHKDWTATLGLRNTWIWSELDETNDAKLATSKSNDSSLIASAGLVYSGFEDWRLRGQYSQGYRYPLLQQLYMGTVHGSSDITYPNPNLKPEKSQSFEVGARYDAEGLTADLAVYYTMAEDYIYRGTHMVNNVNQYTFLNSNSADTFGSELELSYTYEPWHLTPHMSGRYMHRVYDRGANGGTTHHTGDPRWTGKTGLRYEQELSPAVSLHSDVYVRMASHAKEENSLSEITRHGGWATLNLSMGARFGEEQKIFMDINLNNITDKRYSPASASLEDPGFHAVMRLGVEF